VAFDREGFDREWEETARRTKQVEKLAMFIVIPLFTLIIIAMTIGVVWLWRMVL
jgi:hypothetical protein